MSDFSDTFERLRGDSSVSDILLTIRGNASIEGYASKNRVLAANRANALYKLLCSEYAIPDSCIRVLPNQPMSVEAETVLASYPDTVEGIDIAAIRRITRSVAGSQIRLEFSKLDKCHGGPNWTWYKHNVLELTRFAEIRINFTRSVVPEVAMPVIDSVVTPDTTVPEEPSVQADTVILPVAIAIPVVPDDHTPAAADTIAVPASVLAPVQEFRIGTNLLYDAATVANLSFEYGFARHFAVNLSATFNPWDIRRPDIKIRTLLVQPEFRYYLAEGFRGHYFGIEGHYGWYNVAFAGKTRYQDRDGNTPLWGAGLSYGYVLPFSEHWGMDFSLSAGYANLVYDCFYNIENGAKYTTLGKDWWGPTRLGISIYYQF